jgi:hypothetical protein
MKRRFFAVVGALLLASFPSFASPGGPSKPPKPQASVSKPVKPTTQVKPVKATSVKPVKATSVKPTKVNGVKAAKPVKATTKPTKPVKATKAEKTTKSAKAESKKSTTTTATTATPDSSEPGDSTTPTGEEPLPLTKVQEKLQRNTNLASKLESRLPAGTDLMKAAAGFKNLGQFVAAVNVSNNLGISFTKLKTSMVTEGNSLGQSIQQLKPTATATVEAQRAEYDAQRLIATTEGQTTTSTSTTSTTTTTASAKTKKKTVGGTQ